MQEGGMTSQPQQMSLAQQIGTFLQSGMDPRTIAQQLYSEGVDESEIKEAFMDLGMSPSEVDELFKSEEELQEDLQQDLDEAAELAQQDMQSETEVESDSDVQSGIFGNYLPEAQLGNMGVFPMTVNQWFGIQRQEGDDYVSDSRANYLPMDLGMKGTPLGAGFLLAEAATDLFGGKIDPSTGLKQGFYRDVAAKKARAKEAIPEYYDYKITTAAGDPNTYVGDRRDAYAAAMNKGKLRTKEQYESDVEKYSKLDFDPASKKYNVLYSSREIDPNAAIYGKNQKQALQEFIEKSTSLQDFRKRFDPATREMLIGSIKEDKGSLGISPTGEASTYRDASLNPYFYETMMGINTLESKAPTAPNLSVPGSLPTYDWTGENRSPVILNADSQTQPEDKKPLSFREWYLQDPVTRSGTSAQADYQSYVQNFSKKFGGTIPKAQFGMNVREPMNPYPDYSIPMMAYGGDIIYAQVGTETEPMSYDQWLAANDRGMIGQELQDSKDYQAYVASFGPSTSTTASSTTPSTTPSAVPPAQQVTEPKVEIKNKMAGDFNRLMDSRFMQGYGKWSDFAVKGASFINEMFQEEKAKEAEDELYKMTQADRIFGYREDPLNKQGTWDVNTGLAEQDNRTTYMRRVQFGGEDGSSMMYSGDMSLNDEIELDPDTIAQLIAAGANIEIL